MIKASFRKGQSSINTRVEYQCVGQDARMTVCLTGVVAGGELV